jgi:cytochrome bd-type quinol oxidase subunit 2
MNDNSTAEQNLGAIRELIERAEIYRAVSARTALIGGVLSILTAGAIYLNDEVTRIWDRPVRPRELAFAWLCVLFLTVTVSKLFLRGAARESGGAINSRRMKLAVRTIVPYLVIPAAFTGWFLTTGYLGAAEQDLVVVWIAFYGLMLLSTALFAPRALALLGWAFLLTSLSVPVFSDIIDNRVGSVPTVLMGVTFGLYHLIYAGLNWPRKPRTQ